MMKGMNKHVLFPIFINVLLNQVSHLNKFPNCPSLRWKVYECGAFNKFPDFFVQAFKIVGDS